MKKAIAVFIAMLALVAVASADSTPVWTSDAMLTNAQNQTSDPIPVSGYVDSIEIWNDVAAATGTVVVSMYDGSTAAQTLATVTCAGTTPKVVRPRILGTTTAGVDLAAVLNQTATNSAADATTILMAPYEKILAGGTVKAYVVGTVASSNRFNVRIIYEPLSH